MTSDFKNKITSDSFILMCNETDFFGPFARARGAYEIVELKVDGLKATAKTQITGRDSPAVADAGFNIILQEPCKQNRC